MITLDAVTKQLQLHESDISAGQLNFYTMGIIATKEDMPEVEKIAKNPIMCDMQSPGIQA
ncbi:hypothetical protein KIN20_019523 [Parelaphostrongylus tenuis]|uniref:Uncharacterized protein n=1 Tax=Parelaphostrongylus tenuis TaxID=148309 RepID=A0AAD5N5L4_PARTN|nr:hypothetical protein KIN20_019523 [Parelaphostrongylus tenuis]